MMPYALLAVWLKLDPRDQKKKSLFFLALSFNDNPCQAKSISGSQTSFGVFEVNLVIFFHYITYNDVVKLSIMTCYLCLSKITVLAFFENF